MKKAVCLLLALCTLLSMYAVSESGFALDAARINEAAKSVVKLEQRDEDGNVIALASGFAAIAPGLVVTSALVVQSGEELVAVSDDGETLAVSGVLGVNTDSDIAIIALEDTDALTPLPINTEKHRLRGSDCVVIGAQGENISVSIGNMSGFFEEEDISLIQFTAPLAPGASGGPLLDEDGNVAGVTTGFYYDGTGVVQNLNFAVDISHALSLHEIVKEDEVAPFSEWAITDVGLKSYNNPDYPLEFHVKNNSDYDITKVILFKQGEYSSESRISGVLKKGETATIQLSQEEYESGELWIIRFILPKWSNELYDTLPVSLSYLPGKTLELVTLINPNNNLKYPSYELTKTYTVQRRHMPEGEALPTEDELPYNCIKVINDTDMTMTEFSFSHIGMSADLVGSISAGDDKLVFISDKDIMKTDSFLLRTFFTKAGNYSYSWTFKREDILGKTMRFYKDENGDVTYEIQ